LQQLRDHVPHARAFAAVGGFDPAFFLYYEDDDLCLRMQEAGWRCLLQPAARALHPGGASSAPSVRTTLHQAVPLRPLTTDRPAALCQWFGWGLAGLCAAFHLDGIANRIR